LEGECIAGLHRGEGRGGNKGKWKYELSHERIVAYAIIFIPVPLRFHF
jgi:hypothetical protein